MGKMQTKFPSAETGSPGKIEMTGIQINYQAQGDQQETETDQPPERKITRGGMEGAGLQIRTLPLREDPDLERRGKENPPLQGDVLYKKNC